MVMIRRINDFTIINLVHITPIIFITYIYYNQSNIQDLLFRRLRLSIDRVNYYD